MRTTLTIILAFVANIVSAQVLTRCNEILDTLCQSKLTAVYLYTIHTSDADGKSVTDSIQLALQVGDDIWKTWSFGRYQFEKGDSADTQTCMPFMHNETLMHIATTTVGYPKGKITSIETVVPNQYEVTEDMEKPQWKKAKGKKTVCGYQCRKATGEFRGKKWNVCYAADIPTTAGPWKLHGLPGLITYATDEKGVHTFQLISVNEETVPITHSSGYPELKFVYGENNKSTATTKVHPYVKVTREKCQGMMNEIFGNDRYPSDPEYYMEWPSVHYESDLHVITKFDGDKYGFRRGLEVPDKAHRYQPLELK